MNECVGYLGWDLHTFYSLEVIEVESLMKKARERIEFEHYSNFMSTLNAIGLSFSKTYKYRNIFEESNKKTTVTDEEKEEMKSFLDSW